MGENLGKPWKSSKALFPTHTWLRKIRKNQEGVGTSVHRLLRTYVSVIYAFTIFIYSICAQTKNIEDSVCKNARRMEEERKTRSTAGGPFILPWRGGGERGWLYSSDSGHTLLYAIKIIIALQIGQESVKGKNNWINWHRKLQLINKLCFTRLRGKISRRMKMTFAESFGIVQTH